jgi:hypothetical protein
MMPSIYEIEVTAIDGTKTSLAPYKEIEKGSKEGRE